MRTYRRTKTRAHHKGYSSKSDLSEAEAAKKTERIKKALKKHLEL
jgi:hypothetical protein